MSFRTTFILLAALLLLGGYVYFIELGKRPALAPLPPEVWSVREDDIVAIEVRHRGEKTAFRKSQDGRWQFDNTQRTEVNLERWGGIPLLVSGPRSKRLLAQEVDDLGRYGLERSSTEIVVGLNDGQRVDVLLGDKTPDELNYYVNQIGYDSVYLVDATWGDVLIRLVTEPPYPVPTPTSSPTATP